MHVSGQTCGTSQESDLPIHWGSVSCLCCCIKWASEQLLCLCLPSSHRSAGTTDLSCHTQLRCVCQGSISDHQVSMAYVFTVLPALHVGDFVFHLPYRSSLSLLPHRIFSLLSWSLCINVDTYLDLDLAFVYGRKHVIFVFLSLANTIVGALCRAQSQCLTY